MQNSKKHRPQIVATTLKKQPKSIKNQQQLSPKSSLWGSWGGLGAQGGLLIERVGSLALRWPPPGAQVGAKLGPSWLHNPIQTGMFSRSSFWIQFCSLLSSISDTFSGTKWCTKVNLKQKVSNLQNLILAEAGAQFLMFRGVEKH